MIDTREMGTAMSKEEKQRLQRERIARAAEEDFAISWHAPIGKFLVTSGKSGKSYLVTEDGRCDCPDAQFTAGPNGIRCKHAIAATLHRLFSGKNGAR
jgi:SWIM zinc finger